MPNLYSYLNRKYLFRTLENFNYTLIIYRIIANLTAFKFIGLSFFIKSSTLKRVKWKEIAVENQTN